MTKVQLLRFDELKDRSPVNAQVSELDLVVVRYDDFSKFKHSDLSTIDYEMHRLTGISYAVISSN